MNNTFSFSRILLASKSPRRAFLLSEAHLPFRQIDPGIEELHPENLNPNKIPEYLAHQKALATKSSLEKNEVLLSSDSIVLLGDTILEKPENLNQAKNFIMSMSGRKHVVITGVCLMNTIKTNLFSVHTNVFFNHIDEDEIDFYLHNFRPLDKAGAYGIQDWIGWVKISHIEGSYSNVMGLPMAEVYEALKSF